MKCPRCQQESPPPAKFCPECGTPLLGADATQQSYADLKRDIGRLTGELEGLRRRGHLHRDEHGVPEPRRRPASTGAA